jgi:hypothetical protein
VEERSGESEEAGFLPPEPAGPEPELGRRPAQAPPPQPPQPPQPPPTYGYPPPPPGQHYAPPPGQHYAPPPGYGYPPPPPGYAYPTWGYPQPPVPDNGSAVAGFVLSLVSGSLLIISAGFSSVISIVCAILGIVYSRKGKRKVDAGETPKHRGLAQAGFIVGWVSLGLSILATIAWIAVLVVAITEDNSDSGSGPGTVRATAVALSAAARLIGA